MIALLDYFVQIDVDAKYLQISISEKELREFAKLHKAQRIYYLNDSHDSSLWHDYEVFMIIKTLEILNPHALKVLQINIPLPTEL